MRFARWRWFQTLVWERIGVSTNWLVGWGSPRAVKTYTLPTINTRRFLNLVTALFAFCICVNTGLASERSETLQAIHWVENPHNSPKPGPCGELGAYQFREPTWRMHTQTPFNRAIERSLADEIAVKHYEWIKRGLIRAGMPVSAYNVALAWNGGLSATIRGRLPATAHDYAARVHNLATQLGQTRMAQGGR